MKCRIKLNFHLKLKRKTKLTVMNTKEKTTTKDQIIKLQRRQQKLNLHNTNENIFLIEMRIKQLVKFYL